MSGLNPSEIEEIIGLIRRIHAQGVSLLIIEHVMRGDHGAVAALVVLHHGEKIAEGPPEAGRATRACVEAYLGEDRRQSCWSGRRRRRVGRSPALRGRARRRARARSSRWWAPTGRGRRRCCAPSRGCCVPAAARSASRASASTAGPATGWSSAASCTCRRGARCFPSLAVRENLELGSYTRAARGTAGGQPGARLRDVPAAARAEGQAAGTLSGGEQQMLAIGRGADGPAQAAHARRAVARPGAADREGDLRHRSAKINQAGTTVLLVEQNTRQALARSRRGYVLENGRVVLVGTGAELLGNDYVRRAYLGL